MIKIDEKTTEVTGELHEILGDTTHLLRVLYRQLKEVLGEEKANEYFVEMGKMAVMTDEELDKYAKKNIEELKNKYEN